MRRRETREWLENNNGLSETYRGPVFAFLGLTSLSIAEGQPLSVGQGQPSPSQAVLRSGDSYTYRSTREWIQYLLLAAHLQIKKSVSDDILRYVGICMRKGFS